jgi:hypothetical protein
MPALDHSLASRDAAALVRRAADWPSQNVGVMVVFCIVFVVASGLIWLAISKKLTARREAAAHKAVRG